MSLKKGTNKLITKENYYKKLNLKLKVTTKAILDILVQYSNKDYTCYPSQIYISDQLNISRATANRHIKKLERLKYITIIKNRTSREQQFDNNVYFINIFFMTERSEQMSVKNILKNTYRAIEQKLFRELETTDLTHIDNFYTLEKKECDFDIDKFINDLVEKTKLKKISVLSTIVNIQEQMKGNHIFNIKNYIVAAFENAIEEQNMRDKINITAGALDKNYKEDLLLFR